jgi:group I intron endonuclease
MIQTYPELYESIPSGIYTITNLINKKVYVGSSINLKRRFLSHKSLLKRNIHHSKKLQNSFNKYGLENFEFKIIEKGCWFKFLIVREQYWINFYNSFKNGYNEWPFARTALGRKWTDEQRQNFKEKTRGRQCRLGHKHTEETKAKMSKYNLSREPPPHTLQINGERFSIIEAVKKFGTVDY